MVITGVNVGAREALVLSFDMVFEYLVAEGTTRSSIKHVFVTHGHLHHLHHLAGVVEVLETLAPAYPAATILISRAEYDFWTRPEVILCAADEDGGGGVSGR